MLQRPTKLFGHDDVREGLATRKIALARENVLGCSRPFRSSPTRPVRNDATPVKPGLNWIVIASAFRSRRRDRDPLDAGRVRKEPWEIARTDGRETRSSPNRAAKLMVILLPGTTVNLSSRALTAASASLAAIPVSATTPTANASKRFLMLLIPGWERPGSHLVRQTHSPKRVDEIKLP